MTRRRMFFAPRGRSPWERFARGLLMVGIFALVVVAFNSYYRHLADTMAAHGTVADTLGVLSRGDQAWIREQAAAVRKRFGLELSVRLGGDPAPAGNDAPQQLLVYYDPDCHRSRVTAPGLIVSALPEGFLEDLGREHLDAACREGRAREGVLATVGLLTTTLGEAASRGQGEGS